MASKFRNKRTKMRRSGAKRRRAPQLSAARRDEQALRRNSFRCRRDALQLARQRESEPFGCAAWEKLPFHHRKVEKKEKTTRAGFSRAVLQAQKVWRGFMAGKLSCRLKR